MPIGPPPLPPVMPEPVITDTQTQCIVGASRHYGARWDVLTALADITENGKTGRVTYNKNGSFDMGRMGLNSIHLTELAKYGLTKEALIGSECLNIYISAWYLQSRILRRGDLWRGIGDYHSTTPDLNLKYQWLVYRALQVVWARAGR